MVRTQDFAPGNNGGSRHLPEHLSELRKPWTLPTRLMRSQSPLSRLSHAMSRSSAVFEMDPLPGAERKIGMRTNTNGGSSTGPSSPTSTNSTNSSEHGSGMQQSRSVAKILWAPFRGVAQTIYRQTTTRKSHPLEQKEDQDSSSSLPLPAIPRPYEQPPLDISNNVYGSGDVDHPPHTQPRPISRPTYGLPSSVTIPASTATHVPFERRSTQTSESGGGNKRPPRLRNWTCGFHGHLNPYMLYRTMVGQDVKEEDLLAHPVRGPGIYTYFSTTANKGTLYTHQEWYLGKGSSLPDDEAWKDTMVMIQEAFEATRPKDNKDKPKSPASCTFDDSIDRVFSAIQAHKERHGGVKNSIPWPYKISFSKSSGGLVLYDAVHERWTTYIDKNGKPLQPSKFPGTIIPKYLKPGKRSPRNNKRFVVIKGLKEPFTFELRDKNGEKVQDEEQDVIVQPASLSKSPAKAAVTCASGTIDPLTSHIKDCLLDLLNNFGIPRNKVGPEGQAALQTCIGQLCTILRSSENIESRTTLDHGASDHSMLPEKINVEAGPSSGPVPFPSATPLMGYPSQGPYASFQAPPGLDVSGVTPQSYSSVSQSSNSRKRRRVAFDSPFSGQPRILPSDTSISDLLESHGDFTESTVSTPVNQFKGKTALKTSVFGARYDDPQGGTIYNQALPNYTTGDAVSPTDMLDDIEDGFRQLDTGLGTASHQGQIPDLQGALPVAGYHDLPHYANTISESNHEISNRQITPSGGAEHAPFVPVRELPNISYMTVIIKNLPPSLERAGYERLLRRLNLPLPNDFIRYDADTTSTFYTNVLQANQVIISLDGKSLNGRVLRVMTENRYNEQRRYRTEI